MISKTTKFIAILCSSNRKQETEVTLYLREGSLEILSTDHFEKIGVWKLEEIELHLTAAENVYLEHRPTGALLKMKTQDFKKISDAFHSRLSLLFRIKKLPVWPYKIGYSLLVFSLIFCCYWGLPKLLGKLVTAFFTPSQTQSLLSEYGIKSFDWTILESSENEENALAKLKSLLLKNGKLKENEFRIYLVQEPTVNAISLPNGDIALLCGFVNQSETSEEIAGVLAHELGHLYHQHAAKYLASQFFEYFWVKHTEVSSFDLLYYFRNLKFSREQELEADQFASEWLRANGYSTKGLENFFSKMQKKDPAQWTEILSTHPLSDKRIEEIKKFSTLKETETVSIVYLKELKETCEQKNVSREKAQEPEDLDEGSEEGIEEHGDGSIPI